MSNDKTLGSLHHAMTTALAASDMATKPDPAESAPSASVAKPVPVKASATATKQVVTKATSKPSATPPAKAVVVKKPATPAKPSDALDVGQVIQQAAVGGRETAKVVADFADLPRHILVGPDTNQGATVANPVPRKVTLEVWGSGCLTCRALVSNDPDLEPMEELPICHFSRGQTGCPAESVSINIVGPRRRVAQQLRQAKERGDVARLTRLMAKLSESDSSFQHDVLVDAGFIDDTKASA